VRGAVTRLGYGCQVVSIVRVPADDSQVQLVEIQEPPRLVIGVDYCGNADRRMPQPHIGSAEAYIVVVTGSPAGGFRRRALAWPGWQGKRVRAFRTLIPMCLPWMFSKRVAVVHQGRIGSTLAVWVPRRQRIGSHMD